MKKKCILLFLALYLFTSCGGMNAMAEELITPEKIYQLAYITEEEISREDMQSIIDYYSITESQLDGLDKVQIAEGLKSSLEVVKNDVSYLFNASPREGSAMTDENILSFAIRRTSEVFCESLYVDLRTGKYYYHDALDIFTDLRNASVTGNVSEEYIANLPYILELFTGGNASSEYVFGGGSLIVVIETTEGIQRAKYGASDIIPVEAYNQLLSIVNK